MELVVPKHSVQRYAPAILNGILAILGTLFVATLIRTLNSMNPGDTGTGAALLILVILVLGGYTVIFCLFSIAYGYIARYFTKRHIGLDIGTISTITCAFSFLLFYTSIKAGLILSALALFGEILGILIASRAVLS